MNNAKVWFITGASKGLGLALLKKLLKEGYYVAATSRSKQSLIENISEPSEKFLPLEVHLSDEASIAQAVASTLEHFRKIDVLVNNAGYGQAGTVEEVSDQEARQNYEVNVFGLLNVLRGVLPSMRQQKSGHIFNISSVGGYVGGFSGWGVYCSTKFAVAGLTEALHADVKSLGINVTLIYPGYFRTDFLNQESMKVTAHSIADYSEARKAIDLHVNGIHQNQPGDPEKAAEVMIALANESAPPLHMFLGADAYEMVQSKLKSVSAEVDAYKTLTISTGFDA
ncbi:MAG: oxidoreductase [Pseudomonadota bacterium]